MLRRWSNNWPGIELTITMWPNLTKQHFNPFGRNAPEETQKGQRLKPREYTNKDEDMSSNVNNVNSGLCFFFIILIWLEQNI